MYNNNNNSSFYSSGTGFVPPTQGYSYQQPPPINTQPPINNMNSSFSNLPKTSYYSGTTTTTTADQAQRIRQLQADSIIKRFHNAKIVSTLDNNVLDVPITLKNGQQITFRVLMQQAFPQQPPLITTLCTIKHANVDLSGYVVHPQLRQWTQQSSLGDVLTIVFRDFINTPPNYISDELPKNHITKTTANIGMITPPIGSTPPPGLNQTSPLMFNQPPINQPPMTSSTYPPNNTIPSMTNPMTNSMTSTVPTNTQPTFQDSSCMIPLPNIPTNFSEISLLEGVDAVQKLLDSEELFKQFIENLSFTREAKNIYQDLRNANMDIAKRSVEKDEQINNTLKEQITQKKAEVDRLLDQVQFLQNKQQQLSQRYAPTQLLIMLNEKIDEVDNESEQVGDLFLDSPTAEPHQVKEFIDKYLEKRTLYYLRRQKRDRFKDTYIK
ncbi:predicted protein [Naegleria gruberi]|uniref:Predicted protein n=1 Tax=Naegleria gruberi TaxID=5762 RepID=D2W2Y1_NAEGR|nr:uncharacterized protein NAEGRDRAFT_75751 [Naegleria gruberi]EFC36596.1 predicted protein [Naegleria gruberi]|eukprot:XP_002669340.1 predicted protein [Naegleria gruberi strain NEG-M]